MSTVVTKNIQVGTSGTAAQNFTVYQPVTPDGTVRIGNGNSGSVTDLVTLNSSGNLGIGTSSPTEKLTVAGNAMLVGDNAALFVKNAAGNFAGTFRTSRAYTGGVGSYNDLAIATYGVMNFFTNNTATPAATIDSSGQMSTTDGAGNVKVAYDARAWVNFNGTGTVAIRASGNVSSITDNGTGNYTVNFTTAMSDANYAVNITSDSAANNNGYNRTATTNTASAAVVQHYENGGTATDTTLMLVSVFR